jgi:hypothetical protein
MTTKKLKSKLQAAFDACPYSTASKFEQENFNNETGAARPRAIIETINRIRKIESDLETETRKFEQAVLEEEKTLLEAKLETIGEDELVKLIDSREDVEQDYWINYLGKQAAIEVLTTGKTSLETMTKMVKLPEDAYVRATQLCVRLANTIKAATVRAEEAIGIMQPQEPAEAEQADKAPTKLSLKKVK